MTTETASLPPIKKVCQPSCGKVGWNKRGTLLFPFHLMGCCGDDRAVRSTHCFLDVERLDVDFWASVAKAIQNQPYSDWDWHSLQQNVIKPNKEHIIKACSIPNEKVWKRFYEDGYVFLNNWKRDWSQDVDSDDEETHNFPTGENCFKDVDVEY